MPKVRPDLMASMKDLANARTFLRLNLFVFFNKILGTCMQQMCIDNFHKCFSLTCFLTASHHSPCRTKGKTTARVVFKMLKDEF